MLRSLLITFGSRALGALLQAVFLVAMARGLGPSDAGTVLAMLAIALFVMSTLDFGMNTRALRLSGDPNSSRYLGYSLLIRVALTIGIIGSAWLGSYQGWWASVAVAGAVYATGESNGEMSLNVLQGASRPSTAATVLLVRRALLVAPLATGVTYEALLLGMILNGLAGFASLVLSMWGRVARPLAVRELIATNSAFAVTAGSGYVQQLDSAFIASSLGASSAGIYGLATRLNAPLNLLVSGLIQVYVPIVAAEPSAAARLERFRRVRRIVIITSLGIGGLGVTAPWLTAALFGPAFSDGWPMVAAAFVGAGLSGVSQIHLAWFFGTATPLQLSVWMLVISTASIGVVVLLASTLGVVGMAISYVSLQVAILFIIIRFWRRSVVTSVD